uniref:Uncharacterized protein n=1 Tax=Anguilla anguilla TaxID=7936 RepID=A0A0E9QTK2_ANGAN
MHHNTAWTSSSPFTSKQHTRSGNLTVVVNRG